MAKQAPKSQTADLDVSVYRLVRRPARIAAVVLLVAAVLIVAPGWVLSWLGLSEALRLPVEPSVAILLTALPTGLLGAVALGPKSGSPRLLRGLWILVATLPGVVALSLAWLDPSQLAEFVLDFPVLAWVVCVAASALLMRPWFSVGLGLWCAIQYMLVFTAASAHLEALAGPERLIHTVVGTGPALRRALFFVLTGVLAAVLCGLMRRAVQGLLNEQDAHAAEVRVRLLAEAEQSRLEAVSQAKSRFLADLGHELRNPLNALLGHAVLLAERGTLDAQIRPRVDVILHNARHLQELVRDATDTALVETGQVELCPGRVDPSELVDEVLRSLQPLADETGVTLGRHVDSSLGDDVEIDARRLRQVLLNLVSNAIKHTGQGSVELFVEPVSEESWAVMVADTGAGISPEDLERVFEPFTQVGDPAQRTEGLGLGLSITRSLVATLGGRIEINSDVGLGTQVRVVFPRRSSQGPGAPPDEEITAWPGSKSLAAIEEFADLGDMLGVKSVLAALDDDPALSAFRGRVGAAADNFDDKAILVLIAQGIRRRERK